jgi:hypothetical protein
VKYPTKVNAIGGHFLFDDDQETPNSLNVAFEFNEEGKKKVLGFEVRHWMSNPEAEIDQAGGRKGANSVGSIFYGSKGYLTIWDEDHGRYETFLGREREPGPTGHDVGNNWANFIDAVRSRKIPDQNAPIEEGAISVTLVHLANISYRLGRSLHFDPATLKCVGDEEANRMFTRNYRRPFVVPEKV